MIQQATACVGFDWAAVMILVFVALPITGTLGYVLALRQERRWRDDDTPWTWRLERSRRRRRTALARRAEELVASGIKFDDAQRFAHKEFEAIERTAVRDYEDSMSQASQIGGVA